MNPYYPDTSTGGIVKQDLTNFAGDAQLGMQAFQASGGNPYVAAGAFALGSITRQFDKASAERQITKDLNNLKTGNVQTDAYGRPVYNENYSFNQLRGLDTSKIGKPQFSPLDAIIPISGISKLGGSLFGGRKRRRKAQEAKRKAIERLKNFQTTFNEDNKAYSNLEASNLQSNKDLYDRSQRMYGIPTQLY